MVNYLYEKDNFIKNSKSCSLYRLEAIRLQIGYNNILNSSYIKCLYLDVKIKIDILIELNLLALINHEPKNV